jgi:hypothetical protein
MTPTAEGPSASPWEALEPVLLNTWKHHAGVLRHHIAEAVRQGEPALEPLRDQLVVIGTELMDLYTGSLTPADIGAKVLDALRAADKRAPDAYRAWVEEAGGYRVLTFSEDTSRWVLRRGDEDGRYVHVHPARWAPHTRRVRANVLKTAVLVLAHAGIHGGEPMNVKLVNAVRRRYLDLAPVKGLASDEGLGAVIDVLRFS